MATEAERRIAVWAITHRGAQLARQLTRRLPAASLLLSGKLDDTAGADDTFNRLSQGVKHHFARFEGHVFIMATGIVVRMIAPYLKHKTNDPAVVVVDEAARFAVSLTSGHLGGANRLAREVAQACGATAVITTATDVNALPAIDLMAQHLGLAIENPDTLKRVNMAILNGQPICRFDPYGFISEETHEGKIAWQDLGSPARFDANRAGVYVDDTVFELPVATLVLRPATLAVGIGCNRGTPMDELEALVKDVFARHNLSPASIKALASIDLKKDETGLLDLARKYNHELVFYTHRQLHRAEGIQTPSAVVAKHTGAPSVCEAAAILASGHGRLIVTKKKTPNVTVAVARVNFIL